MRSLIITLFLNLLLISFSYSFDRDITELGIHDYTFVKSVTVIHELELRQMMAAREMIISQNRFLDGRVRDRYSKWEIYDVYHRGLDVSLRLIHWNDVDDNSYSVFFKHKTFEVFYLYYEN